MAVWWRPFWMSKMAAKKFSMKMETVSKNVNGYKSALIVNENTQHSCWLYCCAQDNYANLLLLTSQTVVNTVGYKSVWCQNLDKLLWRDYTICCIFWSPFIYWFMTAQLTIHQCNVIVDYHKQASKCYCHGPLHITVDHPTHQSTDQSTNWHGSLFVTHTYTIHEQSRSLVWLLFINFLSF